MTILDLLAITPSPTSTYIIKTDIEGFDCKVGEKKGLLTVFCSDNAGSECCPPAELRPLPALPLHGVGQHRHALPGPRHPALQSGVLALELVRLVHIYTFLPISLHFSAFLDGEDVQYRLPQECLSTSKCPNEFNIVWIHKDEDKHWMQRNGTCVCNMGDVLMISYID